MSSTTGTVGSPLSDMSGDVEIKIEYPEIILEEEKPNQFSTYDNGRKNNQQLVLQDPSYNLWTSKATSCLISQYRKYRSMVGQTTQFRSLRDMFETISAEMKKFGYYFSPQKCENKWRVLERKYKNLVLREMLKKPGRMKHYGHWEHKRALDEIFNEKRKSVYLQESEYPSVGGSTKYALILPKPLQKPASENSSSQVVLNNLDKSNKVSDVTEKQKKLSSDIAIMLKPLSSAISSSNTISVKNKEESANDLTAIETLLSEIKKCIDVTEKNKERRLSEKIVDPLTSASNTISVKNKEEFAKDLIAKHLENILSEIKKCFDIAERNKERRHLEKMAVRKSELKVQEKLLKLKEKKLELEKRKILALAQNIQ